MPIRTHEQVQYRIDLDFCLDRRAIGREDRVRDSPTPQSTAGVFDGAFSFSIPLQVLHSDMPTPAEVDNDGGALNQSGVGETSNTRVQGQQQQADVRVSSVASVQLQALRCLESNVVVLPLRV